MLMGKQMRLEGLWKLPMWCSCDIGAKKCCLWLSTKNEFVMALVPVVLDQALTYIIPKEGFTLVIHQIQLGIC